MKGHSKSDAIWASFMGSFVIFLGGGTSPLIPIRLCDESDKPYIVHTVQIEVNLPSGTFGI